MPGAGNPESPPTAGATSSDQTGAGKKAKAAKASKASAADTSGAASTGTAANTSATAPALSTGMTVKDNTGAAIGTISKLDTGASGSVATIKMGTDNFQVPATSLAVANGAATINLTQAQIAAQVHPK
jgi:hypothetical protein